MSRNFTATIKEGAGGQPFIMIEPSDEIPGLSPGQFITIAMPVGASIESAREVSRMLNHNTAGIRVEKL